MKRSILFAVAIAAWAMFGLLLLDGRPAGLFKWPALAVVATVAMIAGRGFCRRVAAKRA